MPRSSRTKLLLAQTLRELMATTPLEKITVNDIVERAGVGRNTFYYHFEDKYDLVNWYFQSGATKFLVARASISDWASMLEAIEEYFRQDKVFFTRALEYNGQNSLQEYIFDFVCSIFVQRARELEPTLNQDELAIVGRFFAGAFMGILIPWVRGGMKKSPPLNTAKLTRLSNGQLAQLLREPHLPASAITPNTPQE